MQKLTNILEKNVEWAAIGLAVLWVLWVAWSYGMNPVTVHIASRDVTPADADVVVNDYASNTVKPLIDNKEKLTAAKPNIIADFADRMHPTFAGDYGPLALYSPPPQQLDYVLDPNIPSFDAGGGGKLAKISKLPEVPAPVIVDAGADRDQVMQQGPNAAMSAVPVPAAVVMAAAPSAGGRGDNPPPPPSIYGAPAMQPMAPPPPPAGARGPAAEPGAQATDLNWVWVTAKFPEKTLDENFRNANIPNMLNQKLYLEVQLVRQEQLPDGSWGNETRIPPLHLNTPPVTLAADPDRYFRWAQQPNIQPVILTPPFYPTANGTMRGVPGKRDAADAMPVAAPPPPGGDIIQALAKQARDEKLSTEQIRKLLVQSNLKPSQLNEVLKAKKKLDDEAKRNRTAPAPTAPKRPGKKGGAAAAGYDAQDPNVLRRLYDESARPAVRPPVYNDGSAPGPGYSNTGGFPPPMAPMDVNMGPIAHPGQNADFDVWAFDETVVPGKTYRYKMRILVKNPLFGVRNAGADDSLIKVLQMPDDNTSSWSEWTKPIEVKRSVQVYLAGSGIGGREQIRLNVYRWQNGRINKCSQPFTVTIGDPVGGIDRDTKLDFSTGWTVTDIRAVGGDYRVTFIDEAGTQEVHYLKHDMSDPDQKDMDRDVNRPPGAFAPGGMGEMPPNNTYNTNPGNNPPAASNAPAPTRAGRAAMGPGPSRGN